MSTPFRKRLKYLPPLGPTCCRHPLTTSGLGMLQSVTCDNVIFSHHYHKTHLIEYKPYYII